MNRVSQFARDLGLSAQIAAAACTSWLVPEILWPPLTRAAGRALARAHGSPFDRALATTLECSPRDIAIERVATGHASRLTGLRGCVRSTPELPIDVLGREHIDQALADGQGAILWVGRFTWSSLITKIGLHRAGYAVTHLSRPTHGFGMSAFAIHHLNPIWTRIEERFVFDRLVMQPGSETGTLRDLRRRLSGNGLVSITVGHEGARTVEVPFLDATLTLASGPASLAASSAAPLLPVFTVRERSGRFRIDVEPALAVPGGVSRDRRDQQVATSYAARLETWARRYPGQWLP